MIISTLPSPLMSAAAMERVFNEPPSNSERAKFRSGDVDLGDNSGARDGDRDEILKIPLSIQQQTKP